MPAHLFVAHLPLGLAVLGAGADIVGVVLGRPSVRRWASSLLFLAGGLAVLAFLTGSGALAQTVPRTPTGAERVATHTQWAGAGVWLVVLGSLARLYWRRSLQGATGWLALVVAVGAAAVLIGITLSGLAIHHAS